MGKHLAKKERFNPIEKLKNIRNKPEHSHAHNHTHEDEHEHEHAHEHHGHSHEHEHRHGHGHEHGNCHCHEHGHSHGHSHGHEHGHEHTHEHELTTKSIAMAALGAILFVITMLLPTYGWIRLLSFIVPYLVLGYPVLREAVEKILEGHFLEEDFLMTIASIGAFCIGEYVEAVAVMLFYRVGTLFEAYAIGRSRGSIAELMDIRPDRANLETAEGYRVVSPEEAKTGDIILVQPGERIPLDGEIIEGNSSVDTSSLTGESMPRAVAEGIAVMSGCINLTSPIRIRVTSEYAESTASRILALVEDSAANKSKQERFISRFARVYTPAVVAAAVFIAILPPIFNGAWAEWIRRALIFLVASCPCALVVSIPLAYFGGIGSASKHGVLIKGSNYLEALAKAENFVFDKTGTITEGVFSVTDVCPVSLSEQELLTIAAAAESFSNHPIAHSLRAAVGVEISGSGLEIEEIAGRGVSAFIDGRHIYVGNAALLEEHGIECAVPEKSGTAVHVSIDNEYAGHILIADKIKKGCFDALESLRFEGVNNLVMLTGDIHSAARAVASSLNFDMIKSELLPDEKVAAVEYLLATKTKDATLAFVGDGVNDAPVLARADVGIAMGALGSDAAIEAADVVLMDDDIRKLPLALKISKFTSKITRQNIIIALSIKFLVLLLGVVGVAGIWSAVFSDVGVLIIAIINSLRTLKTWKM